MNKEVKASLNRIYEVELLQQPLKKKPRLWLPQLTVVGVVMIGLLLWISGSWTEHTANTPLQQEAIFDLQGTYVGDNSKVSYILNYALGEESYDSFALQTKQQPYGIIVNTATPLASETKYRVALYMWTLVQNVDYIQFETEEQSATLTKEQFSMIDFIAIRDEATLNSTKPLPLNMNNKELATALKEAIGTAEQEQGIVNLIVNKADYMFNIEEEHYYLWLNEQEAVFVKASDTGTLYKVTAKASQQLYSHIEIR